ncbi:MAG: hypothetical protein JNM17_24830 [Archangium sp.]|nr:hypothetical protein [Archangium sp.]
MTTPTLKTWKQWWQRVGFEQREFAERRLLVGTLFGALIAGVVVMIESLASSRTNGTVAICAALFTLIIALPAHPRWLMAMLSFGLMVSFAMTRVTESAAPWVLSVALGVTLALETGLSWPRRVLALVGPAIAVGWFLFVVRWLSARHLGGGTVLGGATQLTAGLFISIGALLSQVGLAVDAVEPRLRFDRKMRETWLRLHAAMKRVSEPTARQKLKDTANLVASRWLDARLEQREAEDIDEERANEARAAVETLTSRLEMVEDDELRRHFEQSLRVHKDVLEQLESLSRKSERAAARARAEADWLDNAAFTLELTPHSKLALTDAVDRLAILARRTATA